jgi:hypothetical protein
MVLIDNRQEIETYWSNNISQRCSRLKEIYIQHCNELVPEHQQRNQRFQDFIERLIGFLINRSKIIFDSYLTDKQILELLVSPESNENYFRIYKALYFLAGNVKDQESYRFESLIAGDETDLFRAVSLNNKKIAMYSKLYDLHVNGLVYTSGQTKLRARILLPSFEADNYDVVRSLVAKGYERYNAQNKEDELQDQEKVIIVVENDQEEIIGTFTIEPGKPETGTTLNQLTVFKDTNHTEVENLVFKKENGEIGINPDTFPDEFALMIQLAARITSELGYENIRAIILKKLLVTTEKLSEAKSESPINLKHEPVNLNMRNLGYYLRHYSYFFSQNKDLVNKIDELQDVLETENFINILSLIVNLAMDEEIEIPPKLDSQVNSLITEIVDKIKKTFSENPGEIIAQGPVIVSDTADRVNTIITEYFQHKKTEFQKVFEKLEQPNSRKKKIEIGEEELFRVTEIDDIQQLINDFKQTSYAKGSAYMTVGCGNINSIRLKVIGDSDEYEQEKSKIIAIKTEDSIKVHIYTNPDKTRAWRVTTNFPIYEPIIDNIKPQSNLSRDGVLKLILSETPEIIEKLKNKKIVIVGAGQVGSSIGSLLASLGFENIQFYEKEDSKIEEKHLGKSQNGQENMGRFKWEALLENLYSVNSLGNYEYLGKWNDDDAIDGDIVVQAFDQTELFYPLNQMLKEKGILTILATDLLNHAHIQVFDYRSPETAVLNGKHNPDGTISIPKLLGISTLLSVEPNLLKAFLNKNSDFYPQANTGANENAARTAELILNLVFNNSIGKTGYTGPRLANITQNLGTITRVLVEKLTRKVRPRKVHTK